MIRVKIETTVLIILNPSYDLTPGDDVWETESVYGRLNRKRYIHMIDMMVNINDQSGSQELFPVAYGYDNISEIYDYTTETWSDYIEMEENVYSVDCFAYNPDDGYYYSIKAQVLTRIDMETGESFNLESTPEALSRPGKCSIVEIDGMPGLMTRWGFWYNLK